MHLWESGKRGGRERKSRCGDDQRSLHGERVSVTSAHFSRRTYLKTGIRTTSLRRPRSRS
jgi:hypothetical protein